MPCSNAEPLTLLKDWEKCWTVRSRAMQETVRMSFPGYPADTWPISTTPSSRDFLALSMSMTLILSGHSCSRLVKCTLLITIYFHQPTVFGVPITAWHNIHFTKWPLNNNSKCIAEILIPSTSFTTRLSAGLTYKGWFLFDFSAWKLKLEFDPKNTKECVVRDRYTKKPECPAQYSLGKRTNFTGWY